MISLALHGGFVGLLALEPSRRLVLSDTPLRVRILQPLAPSLPRAKGSPPPAVPARPSLREEAWNIQASFRYNHPRHSRRN